MRDSQRSKVYAAEEFVRTLFDRADGRGSLDFFGTALTLPPEARFGSVDAVRRYVEDVLALPAVRQRWPAAGACAVRARRGATAAHYEPGVIAVPDRQSTWALRELVVFFGHFTAVYSTIPAEAGRTCHAGSSRCLDQGRRKLRSCADRVLGPDLKMQLPTRSMRTQSDPEVGVSRRTRSSRLNSVR